MEVCITAQTHAIIWRHLTRFVYCAIEQVGKPLQKWAIRVLKYDNMTERGWSRGRWMECKGNRGEAVGGQRMCRTHALMSTANEP